MKGFLKKGMTFVFNFFSGKSKVTRKIVQGELVEFAGITAPLNVNVRGGTSLYANIVSVLPKNTTVTFKGWEIGEAVKDYWTGIWDNRWFYFYQNNQKVFVASAYINGNPPHRAIQNKLGVPDILQQNTNWCWAGAATSVLNYIGKIMRQEEFVRYVKGRVYNYPATSREIQSGLSGFGVNSFVYSGSQSHDWIQMQIDSNQPVIILIMWKNGGSIGHFFVLDGYYKGINQINYLMYMDPWYGDHYYYNSDILIDNDDFWWEETIYNIREN